LGLLITFEALTAGGAAVACYFLWKNLDLTKVLTEQKSVPLDLSEGGSIYFVIGLVAAIVLASSALAIYGFCSKRETNPEYKLEESFIAKKDWLAKNIESLEASRRALEQPNCYDRSK